MPRSRAQKSGALAVPALLLSLAAAPLQAQTAGHAAHAGHGTTGGWISLVGEDLAQWRGFKQEAPPASWTVENGVIAFTPVEGKRGDLISREQFGDFELELEWKISEGGNSGIIYRATEEFRSPWMTGPEMQVLDDERHADGKLPSHRAGALYDLIVPPANIARPVGEWNRVRLVVQGKRIQQWLNGHKTADIVVGSPEWNELYGKSKFREMEAFARRDRGHIVLQDHGDKVWYRNVRIRSLPAGH